MSLRRCEIDTNLFPVKQMMYLIKVQSRDPNTAALTKLRTIHDLTPDHDTKVTTDFCS